MGCSCGADTIPGSLHLEQCDSLSEYEGAVVEGEIAPRRGLLRCESWAGRTMTPVEIVGETPTRYRIRAIVRTRLAGRRRWLEVGDTALIPKRAAVIEGAGEGDGMKHNCHAIGCDVSVPPKLLMCRHHWFMVPKPLRDRVWATYRPGQEIDKRPSSAYILAQVAAVVAVADQERAEAHRVFGNEPDGVPVP